MNMEVGGGWLAHGRLLLVMVNLANTTKGKICIIGLCSVRRCYLVRPSTSHTLAYLPFYCGRLLFSGISLLRSSIAVREYCKISPLYCTTEQWRLALADPFHVGSQSAFRCSRPIFRRTRPGDCYVQHP